MKTHRKKMLRAAAACLAVLCLAALAGCAQAPQTDQQPGQPPVTLRILSVGSSGEEACRRISAALSGITQEKLGFAVELQQAPMSAYDSVLSLQILLGDAPDLFCYMNPEYLLNCVEEGYLAALDGMLKDSPWLKSYVPQELWA